MGLKEVNASDVEVLAKHSGLLVVDCYADWCGPCQVLKPKLVSLSDRYPAANIVALNLESNPDFASKHDIRSIPTLLFFKGGDLVHTLVGNPPEQRLQEEIESRM